LALAAAGVAILGFAGQAHAGAYATSSLLIDNFVINFSNPGQAAIRSFEFTSTNTASLNGVSAMPQSASCGGTLALNSCGNSPTLNALAANAPGGSVVRTDNTFLQYGPGTQTYSNSDSVIQSSQLTGNAFGRTQQIAESELQTSGTGAANAEIQSSTGFLFNFTVSGALANTMTMLFDANPFMRVALGGPNFLNGITQANLNASFTLTQELTGNQVSWAPQGNAANSCLVGVVGVVCTELNDTFSLNRNISISSPNDLSFAPGGMGAFGLSIAGLANGNWSLALNTLTSTQVRLQAVPEPGMLSLVGLSLVALGLSRRRRKVT